MKQFNRLVTIISVLSAIISCNNPFDRENENRHYLFEYKIKAIVTDVYKQMPANFTVSIGDTIYARLFYNEDVIDSLPIETNIGTYFQNYPATFTIDLNELHFVSTNLFKIEIRNDYSLSLDTIDEIGIIANDSLVAYSENVDEFSAFLYFYDTTATMFSDDELPNSIEIAKHSLGRLNLIAKYGPFLLTQWAIIGNVISVNKE